MGKSVVITGANSGIGLITALELAGAGYDVIGTARTKDKADSIVAAATEKGLTVRTVLLDVTDAESTEKGFAKIELAVVKGKKLYDKRDAIAERDSKRDMDRALRDVARGR